MKFPGPTQPFGPHRYKKDGHWYLGASPSKKAVARIKEKVGNLLMPSNTGLMSGDGKRGGASAPVLAPHPRLYNRGCRWSAAPK